MSYDEWKLEAPEHDTEPRAPGCLCDWEIGDSPCPVHGEDEPEVAVVAKPVFPAAHCASHPDTRLTFERHDYRPEWECWCKDCVDGDYDSERGQYVATYPIGSGATLDEALDDYAIRCDVETDTLQVKEGS